MIIMQRCFGSPDRTSTSSSKINRLNSNLKSKYLASSLHTCKSHLGSTTTTTTTANGRQHQNISFRSSLKSYACPFSPASETPDPFSISFSPSCIPFLTHTTYHPFSYLHHMYVYMYFNCFKKTSNTCSPRVPSTRTTPRCFQTDIPKKCVSCRRKASRPPKKKKERKQVSELQKKYRYSIESCI